MRGANVITVINFYTQSHNFQRRKIFGTWARSIFGTWTGTLTWAGTFPIWPRRKGRYCWDFRNCGTQPCTSRTFGIHAGFNLNSIFLWYEQSQSYVQNNPSYFQLSVYLYLVEKNYMDFTRQNILDNLVRKKHNCWTKLVNSKLHILKYYACIFQKRLFYFGK